MILISCALPPIHSSTQSTVGGGEGATPTSQAPTSQAAPTPAKAPESSTPAASATPATPQPMDVNVSPASQPPKAKVNLCF